MATNVYWVTQLYASGRVWIGERSTKAEAMGLYRNGMKNPKVVRVSVDEYDVTTDPFDPAWRVVIDTDKSKIGDGKVRL